MRAGALRHQRRRPLTETVAAGARVRALLEAQALQSSLVQRFASQPNRTVVSTITCAHADLSGWTALPHSCRAVLQRRLCGAEELAGEGGRLVWEPRRCSSEGRLLYANLHTMRPRCPRRRAVLDGLASPAQCR